MAIRDECNTPIPIHDEVPKGKTLTCAEYSASFEMAKDFDGLCLKIAQTVGEDWGQ